jgi:hypothetical protein
MEILQRVLLMISVRYIQIPIDQIYLMLHHKEMKECDRICADGRRGRESEGGSEKDLRLKKRKRFVYKFGDYVCL